MLIGIIIFVSAIAVYIDAKCIGFRRGVLTGIFDTGPFVWAIATLLFWIPFFPLYLIARHKFASVMATRGPRPPVGEIFTVTGGVVFALVIFSFFMPEPKFLGKLRNNLEKHAKVPVQSAPDYMPSTAIPLPNQVQASKIDGWKNIKFGITFDQLKAMNVCHLASQQKDGIATAHLCFDLPFDGDKIGASFIFIKGRLLRIVLMAGQGENRAAALGATLKSKYGKPEADRSTIREFELHQRRSADVNWADGQVTLRMSHSSTGIMSLVMYSDPSYDKTIERSAASASGDL